MQKPDFSKDPNGLIPAIAQDWQTGEVLMLAYVNEEAWDETLKTGMAVYWSRSRNELWAKGKTSGNIQKIHDILIDCDLDTIIYKVEQIGDAACHTGRRTCFYRRLTDDKDWEITCEPLFDPKKVYGK